MDEIDENMTKQSSAMSRVPSCSSHAPSAFGRNDACHSLAVERGERRVVDDHREMKDSAQRLGRAADFSEQTRDIVRRAGIGFYDLHFDSAIAQALNERFGFRRRCAAAAGEHQMPRAAIDQPVGQDFAEAAERAGDEIAAIRFDFEFRCDGFAAPRHK